MARRTSYSWIEGKCCVILLCSSGCFSFSEDTNTCVVFGYLAQFSSWYVIFSHSLSFCLFNASFLVFNAMDSSIKKSSNQGAVGMKSSRLCHSMLITAIGKEIRGFVDSGVYIFPLYIFIVFTSKQKKLCCLVAERVHNRNQFRRQCGYGKSQ